MRSPSGLRVLLVRNNNTRWRSVMYAHLLHQSISLEDPFAT